MRGNLKLFELKSGRGEKLMKNILIISSSPRKKGNSQILCEQFKKGAEAKGHQVKMVRIMEQNIGFCRVLLLLEPLFLYNKYQKGGVF